MPNIFKSFLKPAVNSYVFPDAESLQVEESPEPEGEQAEETPLQEQEPEAPHTAAADALNYAKIQAEKILEDARQQAEELLEQERQHIRQEAEAEKELARADGYRQGYGEGLRHAAQKAHNNTGSYHQNPVYVCSDRLHGIPGKSVGTLHPDSMKNSNVPVQFCFLSPH